MNERANGRNKFLRSEFMNFTFLCQATNEKKSDREKTRINDDFQTRNENCMSKQ